MNVDLLIGVIGASVTGLVFMASMEILRAKISKDEG